MTHYLARLVDRARGTTPRVAPVISSRFAPPSGSLSEMTSESLARETPAKRTFPASEQNLLPPTELARGTVLPPLETPANEPFSRAAERHLAPDAAIENGPALIPDNFRPRDHNRADRIAPAATHSPGSGRAQEGTRPSAEPHVEPPIIRVTIGRIEVRAAPAPITPPRQTARLSGPKLTLDAYLKSRTEGVR